MGGVFPTHEFVIQGFSVSFILGTSFVPMSGFSPVCPPLPVCPLIPPVMAAPDTTADSLKGLLGTTIGLITIAVVFRFVARLQQKAHVRVDDWLTVPVLIAFIAGSSCYLHMISIRSLGYSSFEVSKEEVKEHVKKSQTFHTTTIRKVCLLGIILLACFGFAASTVRVVVFTQIVNAGAAAYRMARQRQLTRAIFYMALELGIMAVAINLPLIWVVFAKVGPESIIRSVRSAISLASIGPHRSGGSLGSRGQHRIAKVIYVNLLHCAFACWPIPQAWRRLGGA
ncbi:hypothetical protein LMH87_009902 [Akanthomyces muscarius]|uniref:Uncharacterized protein n=1 Tax=Akanthomyces muscarius TaxID=2231603 RepID=A0A9W8UJZ6_AKAMU|nr:hypothetical protein LMH87_009902 [Akanthomyces muscarius]KAJ4153414.1 hypothetical protein LMH87_009902 [Akanthomyces muscarius]